MSKATGENIDITEVEEGGIELLVFAEGIVATEGFSTWEKGIRKDVVGGSDVWRVNKTHGEGGVVSLANSVDTNGSSQVSSTIGFKSTWEKEDLENKG